MIQKKRDRLISNKNTQQEEKDKKSAEGNKAINFDAANPLENLNKKNRNTKRISNTKEMRIYIIKKKSSKKKN
jgi:hypothetical protein